MKSIIAVLSALFLVVLLVACSAQRTITPTALPTTSSTATAVASSTPAPTATLAPTIAPSDTPAPTLVVTPRVAYKEECITMEEEFPDNLKLDGALVISDDQDRLSLYHLDMMSHRGSPFPNTIALFDAGEYASLSPDGKWLAYIKTAYNEGGQQKDRILQVSNAEGRHIDMSYWSLNWQYLIGWQDDSHLLLYVPGFRGGDYIILNPFDGQMEVVDVKVPAEIKEHDGENELWNNPNSQLSHWFIRSRDANAAWQLMDSDWSVLWKGNWPKYGYDVPDWSPNGKRFKVMEGYPGRENRIEWKLVVVNLNGTAVPVTNNMGEGELLSWSPDSRFLAGWLQMNSSIQYDPDQLVLIDTEKPLVTDLCFENLRASRYDRNSPPVWSPDGRFLAIRVSRVQLGPEDVRAIDDVTNWDTAIIDLEAHHGYILLRNAQPLAWMRKP